MTEFYEILKRENDDSESRSWIRDQSHLLLKNHLWVKNSYRPEVQVRMFYTNQFLCTNFRVFEENPTVTYDQMNSPVYRDSCVEFFIQPAPVSDGRYINFEFNAAGTLLLCVGSERNDRTHMTDMDVGIFGIETAIGRLEEDTDRIFWELTFRVPFLFISTLFPQFQQVPGTVMRGNFYKCGDATPAPHYVSWNPITAEIPDFHRSADFGELCLGSVEGSHFRTQVS